ncbi:hypothetical protein CPB83DRAFT_849029 [Crepidotus variabilis]|uniref:Uncharacterized protein n=1 Tax=Crepidotus variabilis TaxID=179855 RepID=A0A9P6EKH3_9AGAR|nr:hypothetical protein CPB83DRAFT_849029 [Crepidotus variabilis]
MSLTAISSSTTFKNTSHVITVPDNDVGRLMYYLCCVTKYLALDILPGDVTDYQNWATLPAAQAAAVFQNACILKPEDLIGQLIFRDEAGEVLPKGQENTFVSITSAQKYATIQQNVFLSGQTQSVSSVMFFKHTWLEKYYYQPLKSVGYALRGIQHCDHCRGLGGNCVCPVACPLRPETKCSSDPAWFLALLYIGGAFMVYVFYRGAKSFFA